MNLEAKEEYSDNPFVRAVSKKRVNGINCRELLGEPPIVFTVREVGVDSDPKKAGDP